MHQEAEGALAVFGHHHRAAESLGASARFITLASDSTGMTLPRRLIRPSTPSGMLRRLGDGRRLADLAHLEDVDAEGLAGAQREQQDLHAVGAGQLGARIDAVQQRGDCVAWVSDWVRSWIGSSTVSAASRRASPGRAAGSASPPGAAVRTSARTRRRRPTCPAAGWTSTTATNA